MQTSRAIINSAENNEYSFARLSKDTLTMLAKLYWEVYASAVATDFFARKYDTAYIGVENVGFIAYDHNKNPVGYFGVIPCFIQFESKIILAAQSADAMTHPAHRNQGIFMKLSNMTLDLCRELNILLIFGFPNQDSYPTMINRLGWIETERMSRFSLQVNKFWAKKLFRSLKETRSKALDRIRLPQAGISNSMARDGYGCVFRDDAYLHYKTFNNTYVVKLGLSDTWIKTGKELIVGDIILRDNDDIFFEGIRKLAHQLHLDRISFQVCNGCTLYDLFASRCEAIPSFPVLFKDLGSGLPLKKIKFTFADIDIF